MKSYLSHAPTELELKRETDPRLGLLITFGGGILIWFLVIFIVFS
jgi:hypothetical protein